MNPITLPEEMLRWFREGGLPVPPLPPDLAADLEEEADGVFFAELPGKSLRLGFAGYGLQSRRFEYELKAGGLDLRLSIPCARALADSEGDFDDLRRGFALAKVCLAASERGWPRPEWAGGVLEVAFDEWLCETRYRGGDGEVLFEGHDLDALLDALDSAFDPDGNSERWTNWLRG